MTWKDAALAHAKEQDPKESCGLLVEIKGKEKYFRVKIFQIGLINVLLLTLLIMQKQKILEKY